MRHRLWFAALVVFAAFPLGADEPVEPNMLDLAAHRALARVIVAVARPLDEFTTDGCSGGLSEAWRVVAGRFPDFAGVHGGTPPWEACCVTHDHAYHAGGRDREAANDFQDRVAADRALRACVVDSGRAEAGRLAAVYETTQAEIIDAYQLIGDTMYLAVRIGGGPCSGLPWRWGFGSAQCAVKPEDLFEPVED